MAIDDKTVRRLANDDPDLQPLWDSLGGTPGRAIFLSVNLASSN
jgi:hypothetical protein